VSDGRPPIYFVRHGETDWNRQGLIQGWIDTPLNDRGHAQARAVAASLADSPELSAGFSFVVSPLLRARQTMGYIAEALALEPEQIAVRDTVKELGFGIWEGKPFWELKASPIYPADTVSRYFWRPERGESYEDGEARIETFVAALTAPTVVVAHGAIGRCLIGHVCGLRPGELVGVGTPQGAYCRLHQGKAEWFDAGGVAA